jgi:hypothetical protein
MPCPEKNEKDIVKEDGGANFPRLPKKADFPRVVERQNEEMDLLKVAAAKRSSGADETKVREILVRAKKEIEAL